VPEKEGGGYAISKKVEHVRSIFSDCAFTSAILEVRVLKVSDCLFLLSVLFECDVLH
jgi:hypothetical protein